MNGRAVLLGLASGATTVLLVGALVIGGLSGQFGESPGVGIIGVFVGFLAGLLAVVAVTVAAERVSGAATVGLVAYATFGVAFLLVAGLRYVNVPGADETFTFPVHLASSLAAAIVAAALTRRAQVAGGRGD